MKLWILMACMFVMGELFADDEDLLLLTTEFPPFQYQGNGAVEGISAEVARAVFSEAGLPIEPQILPWGRAKSFLDSRPNTAFFNLTRTPERESLYHWIAPITKNQTFLWQKQGRSLQIDPLSPNLTGLQFAVLKDSAEHHWLLSQTHNSALFTFVPVNTQLLLMLQNERVELIVLNETVLKALTKELGIAFDQFQKVSRIESLSTDSYLAASQGTEPQTITRLRQAWESLESKGVIEALRDAN